EGTARAARAPRGAFVQNRPVPSLGPSAAELAAYVRKPVSGCQTACPDVHALRTSATTSASDRGSLANSPMAAIPAAPAAATFGSGSAVTPPIARTGTATERQIRASPSTPSHCVNPGLEDVGKTVPATR